MSKVSLVFSQTDCCGCHTCEVACKQEHGYPEGRWGIMVKDCTRETNGKVQVDFLPFPTDLCDLCVARTRGGEQPACVKHCMAACMKYGKIEDLAKEMANKPRQVLWVPKKVSD